MSGATESIRPFKPEDHQAAYIFDPEEDSDAETGASTAQKQQRPSKRRRVSKNTVTDDAEGGSLFVPLLNGAEGPDFVRLRERLYEESWGRIEGRIQDALRESNSATLEQVTSFVGEAQAVSDDRIPCAFVTTGTNIDSQNLLFDQLAEYLARSAGARFVRLRSSEATGLKGTLKKVIRDATDTSLGDDEDDLQVSSNTHGRRRFLDYDLEALHAFVREQGTEHVFVAFEDSEGFDSALLSELIVLFNSWRPRIPFTLLFGVATSVELLQARLLKSACQRIYGAQFDAVQSDSILETVFRIAVAASDVPVRLGGSLLHAMLQRQHEQVAGIQAFIASIKYAYMCHFYGNALSVLPALQGSSSSSGQADEALPALQPEHLEAMRNTTSYQTQVELLLDEAEEAGVEDLPGRLAEIEATILTDGTAAAARRRWESSALRTLLVLHAAGALRAGFSSSYADAMSGGIVVSESSALAERVRRMDDAALADLLHRAARIYETGGDGPSGADVDVDACAGGLSLGPSVEPEHQALRTGLQELARELQDLRQKHHDEQAQQQQQQNQQDGVSSSGAGTGTGTPLRSKYWGQNKVMRTTVIAQRVQLSKDSAALSEADKAFTRIVDGTTRLLAGHLGVGPAGDVLLGEAWVYESRTPSRDVLVPRPLVVFERALVRPQDYLACECCADGPAAAQDHDQGTTGQEDHDQETAGQDHDETGTAAATDNELQSKKRKTLETGVKPTMPATSILYQLYLETGSLINVADLWEAFYAVVGRPPQAATETEAEDGGEDERRVLVEFYRGLAELRALGFVKASKKKADHVAKLRWI